MKYNIMVLSDIHWGAIVPIEQEKSLEFVFEFIDESIKSGVKPDLLVLAGDYFDSKLPLNSQEAILAIKWFHRLYNVCADNQIMIRMFQGTMDHDNDQLEVFQPLTGDLKDIESNDNFINIFLENNQTPKDFFKIFMTTTVEETLPGLKCCYCPDETINTEDYEERYIQEILELKDIGFFHGSFDVVYGELLTSKPELLKKNNVIYRYNMWNPQIKGPMIAGHWHDGKQYNDLYYCGSPFRWKFNENEEKGFIFLQYDTEDSSYFVKKITNPLCADYITYEVYTNLYETQDDYTKIVMDVRAILEAMNQTSLNSQLRILVYVVDEKTENDVFLSALRQEVINHRNCKITIKNKLKDKKKKEKVKEAKEENEKYSFIFEKGSKPQNVIHTFILSSTDNEVDIPIDYIAGKVKKYL
jgi:DNA repair exonuclease SbcCD nuclease subunit